MLRKSWRPLLIIVGLMLVGIGVAQAQELKSPPGPDYEVWFQIMLGVIMALIGAYAKGLERRIAAVENGLQTQQRSIDRDYHTKADTTVQFQRIEEQIGAIHRRLDFMRVPSAFQTGPGPSSMHDH